MVYPRLPKSLWPVSVVRPSFVRRHTRRGRSFCVPYSLSLSLSRSIDILFPCSFMRECLTCSFVCLCNPVWSPFIPEELQTYSQYVIPLDFLFLGFWKSTIDYSQDFVHRLWGGIYIFLLVNLNPLMSSNLVRSLSSENLCHSSRSWSVTIADYNIL